MPRYNHIVLNLPGAQIAEIIVGILRPFGLSAIELAAARITAKRVFNNHMFRNLRRLVFPAVQRRLPVRTGRLKRSFRMLRHGDNAVFTVIWYGQQRIIRPRPRVTVRGAIVDEFVLRAQPVIGQALQAALDAV